MSQDSPNPQIFFIATPIGNLGDITYRAVEALKSSDLIACEDTRHTKRLLNHLEISKPLVSLNAQSEARKIPELIEKAHQGQTISVVSDAGMPAISDPGQRFVQACLTHEISYTVLPGASAVLTALVGSGFPAHHFEFGGFLPMKKGKKRTEFSEAIASKKTTLFFESPHRLMTALQLLEEVSPDHPICVARELTKFFETFHRGTVREVHAHFVTHPPKGEIVLLIAPSDYKLPEH